MSDHDPIAVEIHRQALQNIVNEMGLTLVRTSGSSVVTDAMDFSTCLMDENAEQLSLVAYVLVHAASSWLGTKTLVQELEELGEEPRPGDGWIVNDPLHGAAVHQGDVGIIMPTFSGTQHIGWSFANVHVMDVGGAAVSGFNPGAHTVYEEGIRFPLVRIIHDGQLERSWERYIAANVRVPGPVINDLRSMIAANNVAQRKVVDLVDHYGLKRHREYCAVTQRMTEELLRSRIEALPDGIYQSRDWGEFDGHNDLDRLWDVGLRMEVSGSDLRFTFSGDPQADNYINSAEGGAYGCMITAVLTMLGYGDLPFNAGIWRPLHVDLGPAGTVVNAVEPAPVSSTHAEVGYRVLKLTRDVLAQAMALSSDPALRARCASQASDGAGTIGVAGRNQRGKPCVVYYLDTAVGQGGPAQTIGDGQDAYGGSMMAGCGIADVETHEAVDPVLFLWRRINVNSGGAGLFRGGQGTEQAYLIDGTDRLDGFAKTPCAEIPSRGVGGGLPGAASSVEPVFASNAYDLMSRGSNALRERLEGDTTPIRNKQSPFSVARGDVVQFFCGGGGGLGDPLARDPALVGRDVADGYITPDHARVAYAVVVDPNGAVDQDATHAERKQRLTDRIGGTPERAWRAPADPGVSVTIAGTGDAARWVCCSCETELGAADGNWRDQAVLRESGIVERYAELGVRVRPRRDPPNVVLREYFCPACAAALGNDVTLDGLPPNPAPQLLGVAGSVA